MKVNVMQVGPIGTNCYILKDETTGKAAVIDPGDEAERILAALKEDGASVTLQIKGGGPLGTLLAVSDNQGNVRGLSLIHI